jgi:diguanylate cyclase
MTTREESGGGGSVAERCWSALRTRGIDPTPRNYELVYTHVAGGNPELSRRLEPHMGGTGVVSPAALESLYEEFVSSEVVADVVDGNSDAIAEAAQTLVGQVQGNQEALVGYGNTLAHWAGQLGTRTTVDDLLQAVVALTAETSKASARNRKLEHELSASAVRIAKLRQDLVEVRQEATTDALTGIANRKAFEGKLRRALARARTEPANTFTVLFLDIDHFKRFNDTHGHRTGDQVLRFLARLLSDNVKGRDTAARYGGEEFAIILADADQRSGLAVARQICQRLSAHRLVKKGTGEAVGQITVSVGVAQHRPGDTGATVVERADAALYEAKRLGRNQARASAG